MNKYRCTAAKIKKKTHFNVEAVNQSLLAGIINI